MPTSNTSSNNTDPFRRSDKRKKRGKITPKKRVRWHESSWRRGNYYEYRHGHWGGVTRRIHNRVCPQCRLTFPGNVGAIGKRHKYTRTSVCPKCGGELFSVSNVARAPRRHQKKAWRKFLERFCPRALIALDE